MEYLSFFFFFFFFQAEDGIRDLTVTGVQTCALPICPISPDPFPLVRMAASLCKSLTRYRRPDLRPSHWPKDHPRSEEHTSELQSQSNLVCRLLLVKKNKQLKQHLNNNY